MKYIVYIGLCIGLFSCKTDTPVTDEKEQPTETTTPQTDSTAAMVDKQELVEVKNNIFTEYYPGKKAIKFQGPQDPEGNRHGAWLFFSEEGLELSMTVYQHGKKHGHTIVKYPNGMIRYTGEYYDDKQVGVWKTYSITGELTSERDFGSPEAE